MIYEVLGFILKHFFFISQVFLGIALFNVIYKFYTLAIIYELPIVLEFSHLVLQKKKKKRKPPKNWNFRLFGWVGDGLIFKKINLLKVSQHVVQNGDK
jgi:hypothetical protein